MAEDLNTIAMNLTDCVCDALADAGRPTCDCGMTVGTAAVGVVCDCGTTANPAHGSMFVHLVSMYAADPTLLTRINQVYPCRQPAVAAEFDIELFRCFPTIDNQGEGPSADAQTEAALELHADVQDMWKAVTCCEGLRVMPGDVTINDPEGGISLITFRVTIEVTPTRSTVSS